MIKFSKQSQAWSRRKFIRAAGAQLVAAPVMVTAFKQGAQASEFAKQIMCPEVSCGYRYNPSVGDPDFGVAPGTAFADLPEDWECPECGTPYRHW